MFTRKRNRKMFNNINQRSQATASSGSDGKGLEYPTKRRQFTASILPPEMLDLIFKKVESPKDLLNCWNTSFAWAAALRSTDFYFKMSLPFVLPYLSEDEDDLISLSSVSKSWNEIVDTCIQEAEDFGSESRLNKWQRNGLKLEYVNLSSSYSQNGIMLFKENSCGEKVLVANPVAFRRVEVKLRFDETRHPRDDQLDHEGNHNQFSIDRNNLLKVLDRQGHLIRHLHLDFSGDGVKFLEKLKLIRSSVKRTPNLRVLCITAPRNLNEKITPTQELEAFNVFISNNQWHALQHLKVLKFDDWTNREEFASLTTAYASQLLYLKFGFKLVTSDPPLTNQFTRLQKIVYVSNSSDGDMNFGAFLQLIQCPLKDLTIVLVATGTNGKGLTVAVRAVSATLETFALCLPQGLIPIGVKLVQPKLEQLRLPKLKELKLNKCDQGYPSIQLLKRMCPALQKLFLGHALSNDKRTKKIKLKEMYSDLYSEHLFWSELQQIQSVEYKYYDMSNPWYLREYGGGRRQVKTKIYSRGQYYARVEKNQATENGTRNFNQSSCRKKKKTCTEQAKRQKSDTEGTPSVLMTRSKKNLPTYLS